MKKIITGLFLVLCQYTLAQDLEMKILNAVNAPTSSDFGDPFFEAVSSSSYVVSIAAPVAVFSAGVLKKNQSLRWKSYQMAAGIGLSMSACLLLKYSVNRARPAEHAPFIFQKTNDHSPSFPSGHTTAAFETAMSMSLNYPKWYVIVPAYAWATSVAYSRMYLGVHYPSDVAVGILLGTGSAWLTWKVHQKIQKRRAYRFMPKETE